MSIKDVLVHLNDDRHSDVRLSTSIAVAGKFDAHLIGLYAPVAHYLPGYVMPYFTSEMLRSLDQRKEQAEADAKSRFDAQIQQAGVRAEWRQADGDAARVVANQRSPKNRLKLSPKTFRVLRSRSCWSLSRELKVPFTWRLGVRERTSAPRFH